jgi:hypothetical protein
LVESLRRVMRDGLTGNDTSAVPVAAEAGRKQEEPEAENEAEDVFEELVEEAATPMAEVLS